tara:strand:- start:912 stop:15026 length:14115 start_codon:yes stop_codon:yes gene_type:complete
MAEPTDEERELEDALRRAIQEADETGSIEPLKANAGVSSEVDDLTLELTGAIDEAEEELEEEEEEERRENVSVFELEISNGTLELSDLQFTNLLNYEEMLRAEGKSDEEIREEVIDFIDSQSTLGAGEIEQKVKEAFEAEGQLHDNRNFLKIRVLNRGAIRIEMPGSPDSHEMRAEGDRQQQIREDIAASIEEMGRWNAFLHHMQKGEAFQEADLIETRKELWSNVRRGTGAFIKNELWQAPDAIDRKVKEIPLLGDIYGGVTGLVTSVFGTKGAPKNISKWNWNTFAQTRQSWMPPGINLFLYKGSPHANEEDLGEEWWLRDVEEGSKEFQKYGVTRIPKMQGHMSEDELRTVHTLSLLLRDMTSDDENPNVYQFHGWKNRGHQVLAYITAYEEARRAYHDGKFDWLTDYIDGTTSGEFGDGRHLGKPLIWGKRRQSDRWADWIDVGPSYTDFTGIRMPTNNQSHGAYQTLSRMIQFKDKLQFSDDDLVTAMQNLHLDMLPDQSLREVYLDYMGGDATWGASLAHYSDSDIMRGLSKWDPLLAPAEAILDRSVWAENPRGVKASDWIFGYGEAGFDAIRAGQRLATTLATPVYELADWVLLDTLPDQGIEDARGTNSIKTLWGIVSTNVSSAGFLSEEQKQEYLRKAWLNFSRKDLHFRWMHMDEYTSSDLIAALRGQDQWTPEWASVVGSLAQIAAMEDPDFVLTPNVGQNIIDFIERQKSRHRREGVEDHEIPRLRGLFDVLNKAPLGYLPAPLLERVDRTNEKITMSVNAWRGAHTRLFGHGRSTAAGIGTDLFVDKRFDVDQEGNPVFWHQESELIYRMRIFGAVAEFGATAIQRYGLDPLGEVITLGAYDRPGRPAAFTDEYLYKLHPEAEDWGLQGALAQWGVGLGADPDGKFVQSLRGIGFAGDIFIPWETGMIKGGFRVGASPFRYAASARRMPGASFGTHARYAWSPKWAWNDVAPQVTPAQRQARAQEIFDANANALLAEKMDAQTAKIGGPTPVMTVDDLSQSEVNRLWRTTRRSLEREFRQSSNYSPRQARGDVRRARGIEGDEGSLRFGRPKDINAPFPGVAATWGEMALRVYEDNIAKGRNPFHGLPKSHWKEIYDSLEVVGLPVETVRRIIHATAEKRGRTFVSRLGLHASKYFEGLDKLQESEVYKRIQTRLEDMAEKGTLKGADEGLDAIKVQMKLVERLYFAALSKTGSVEDALEVLAGFEAKQFGIRYGDDLKGIEIEDSLLKAFGLKFDPISGPRFIDIDVADELVDQLKLSDDEGWRLAGIRSVASIDLEGKLLEDLTADQLVMIASKIADPKVAHQIVSTVLLRRLIKAIADNDDAAVSKIRAALTKYTSTMKAESGFTKKIKTLRDNIAKAQAEIKRTTKSTSPEVTPGFGKQALLSKLDDLREAGLPEDVYVFLYAMVHSLPSRVLRDIKLDDWIDTSHRGIEGPEGSFGGSKVVTLEGIDKKFPGDRVYSLMMLFDQEGRIAGSLDPMRLLENEKLRALTFEELINRLNDGDISVLEGVTFPQLVRKMAHSMLEDGVNLREKKFVEALIKNRDALRGGTNIDASIKGFVVDFIDDAAEGLAPVEAAEGWVANRIDAHAEALQTTDLMTYTFAHEMGHAIMTSFLSDTEVANLRRVYFDELKRTGLVEETSYTRWNLENQGKNVGFYEWYAEKFAEYVVYNKMPEVISRSDFAPSVRKIFNRLILRLKKLFRAMNRKNPRAFEDFHPMFRHHIERLFEGKASELSDASEINRRRLQSWNALDVGPDHLDNLARPIDDVIEELRRLDDELPGKFAEDLEAPVRVDDAPFGARETEPSFEGVRQRQVDALPKLEKTKYRPDADADVIDRHARLAARSDYVLGSEKSKHAVFTPFEETWDAVTGYDRPEGGGYRFSADANARGDDWKSAYIEEYESLIRGYDAKRAELDEPDFNIGDRVNYVVTSIVDGEKVESVVDGYVANVFLPGSSKFDEGYRYRVRTIVEAGRYPQTFMVDDADIAKMSGSSTEPVRSRGREMYGPPAPLPDRTVAPPTSSAEFKSWFKDSKVVDDQGKPLRVFHGSPFSFEEFQPGNVEGYFGSSIYFTDSIYDLTQHYAFSSLDPRFMEKGTEWFKAFNEHKSNLRVEFDGFTDADIINAAKDFINSGDVSKLTDAQQSRLAKAIDDGDASGVRKVYRDLIVDFIAKVEFETDGAMQAYPVYLSLKNPLILDQYGKMKDAAHSFRWADDGTGESLMDAIDVVAARLEKEGVVVDELERTKKFILDGRKTKNGVTQIEAWEFWDRMVNKRFNSWGPEGNRYQNEFARQVVEQMGYDGIIANAHLFFAERYDPQTRQWTPGQRLPKDDTHYMVFEPAQAKSVNNKGTWAPTDRRMMYGPPAPTRPEPLSQPDRQALDARRLVGPKRFAEQLLDQMDQAEEVAGGTPHQTVDDYINKGLSAQVSLSQLSAHQVNRIRESLGTASELVDVSRSIKVKAKVDGVDQPVSLTIDVVPMTKDLKPALIPGGLDGAFSFHDLTYLSMRPVELNYARLPEPSLPDVEITVDGQTRNISWSDITNPQEIINKYIDEYDSIIGGLYDKKQKSADVDSLRPNPAEYFDGEGNLIPSKRLEYQQRLDLYLTALASRSMHSLLDPTSRVFENQVFTAVTQPRSIRELYEMGDRYMTALSNKGSNLTRNEILYIMRFYAQATERFKNPYRGALVSLNVAPELLDTIKARDWQKPSAPIIDIDTIEMSQVGAGRILDNRKWLLLRESELVDMLEVVESPELRQRLLSDLENVRTERIRVDAIAVTPSPIALAQHLAESSDSIGMTADNSVMKTLTLMTSDFNDVVKGNKKYSWFERHPNETWLDFSDRFVALTRGLAPDAPVITGKKIDDFYGVGKPGHEDALQWFFEWKHVNAKADYNRIVFDVMQTKQFSDLRSRFEAGEIDRAGFDHVFKKAVERRRTSIFQQRADVEFDSWMSDPETRPYLVERANAFAAMPELVDLFPSEVRNAMGNARRIDSSLVQKQINKVKSRYNNNPKRLESLNKTLEAHKTIEGWIKTFGRNDSMLNLLIRSIESGRMSNIARLDSNYRRLVGDVSTELHKPAMAQTERMADTLEGQFASDAFSHPGASFLPNMRTLAFDAALDSVLDANPWLKQAQARDELAGNGRTASASIGPASRGVYPKTIVDSDDVSKPGSAGRAFKSRGRVMYGPPSSPFKPLRDFSPDDFDAAALHTKSFFETGDVRHLFAESGKMLASLMVDEFDDVAEFMYRNFDSEVLPDGTRRLTTKGWDELGSSFAYYFSTKHAQDGPTHNFFRKIIYALHRMWRMIRADRVDELSPEAVAFFDEQLDVGIDISERAKADVLNDRELKNFYTVRLTTKRGLGGEVAQAGKRREAARIEARRSQLQRILNISDDTTEVNAVDVVGLAVRHVYAEAARKKWGAEKVVRLTTRTIVPVIRAERIRERVANKMLSVFGNPQRLADSKRVMKLQQRMSDEVGSWLRDPETGKIRTETVFDDATGRPVEIPVFDLNRQQQSRVRVLVQELGAHPLARDTVPKWMFEADADFSVISVVEYNKLHESITDMEAGVGSTRSRLTESVSPNLVKRTWATIVDAGEEVPFLGAMISGFRKRFKVFEPFEVAGVLEGDSSKRYWSRTGYVTPELVEAKKLMDQEIDDIPHWLMRVQLRLQKEGSKGSILEVVQSLTRMLTPPLDVRNADQVWRLKDSFSKVGSDPITLQKLESKLDAITGLFAASGRMTDGERAAIIALRDLIDDAIQQDVVELSKHQVNGLRDSIDIIERGLHDRYNLLDQRVTDIVECISGSAAQAKAALSVMDDATKSRLYSSFYGNDWPDLFEWAQKHGLETGTRPDVLPAYDARHAAIQLIVRMRAREIQAKFVDKLVEIGITARTDDLVSQYANGKDATRFMERVKHYINMELRPGGAAIVRDAEGNIIQAPSGFREGRRGDIDEVVRPAEPGAAADGDPIYPRQDWDDDTRRIPYLDLKAPEGAQQTHTIHDMAAYTAAHEILNAWGFKFGSATEDWVDWVAPDGSRTLVPPMVLDELNAAIDRVSGQGAFGKGAKGRVAEAFEKRGKRGEDVATELGREFLFGDEALDPELRLKPGVAAKILIADTLDYTLRLYGFTYSMLRQGVTVGIGQPNVHYYQGITVGSLFQIYQKSGLGLKVGADGVRIEGGLIGALAHPRLSGILSARLWGDGPNINSVSSARALVCKDGRIFTTEMLLDAMKLYKLNTSFVKSGNASHMLRDLEKNEAAWHKIVAEAPGQAQRLLVETATSIDNYFRSGVFVDELYNGRSMAEAAKTATDAMYDYSKLTDWEKQVLRRGFLFYSYTRNNLNLFYDTLVTNPHRLMAQIRMMRGLNQQNTEGSSILMEDDYTSQRLSVLFRNAHANKSIYQGVRFLAAPVPLMDAINLHREIGAFISGGFNRNASKEERENGLRFLARLNPLLQQPLVYMFDEEIFRTRGLAGDVIPTSIVELDIYMTGGLFVLDFLDATPVPITNELKKEYPSQTEVWVAQNPRNYWLWKNALQMPVPVIDIPGETWVSKIPKIGQALDQTVPSLIIRSIPQIPSAIKERRFGIIPSGRSADSWVQFDRADVGYVETVLYLANKMREYREHHGYIEEDLFGPTTPDKNLYDKIEDSSYWTRGVGPRPEIGLEGERLGVFFRPRLVKTPEAKEVELTERLLWEEKQRAKEIKPPRER